jgi:hypothetical protein
MVAKSGLCVAAMLSAFTELAPSFGIRANSLCTYAAVFNLFGFFQPKLFVFLGRNVNELMNARVYRARSDREDKPYTKQRCHAKPG